MVVDLLSWNGEIARRYRYDFEAFSRCLACIAGCVQDKEEKVVYPFTKRLNPFFLEVRDAKSFSVPNPQNSLQVRL
jgi:hypothetical protein